MQRVLARSDEAAPTAELVCEHAEDIRIPVDLAAPAQVLSLNLTRLLRDDAIGASLGPRQVRHALMHRPDLVGCGVRELVVRAAKGIGDQGSKWWLGLRRVEQRRKRVKRSREVTDLG